MSGKTRIGCASPHHEQNLSAILNAVKQVGHSGSACSTGDFVASIAPMSFSTSIRENEACVGFGSCDETSGDAGSSDGSEDSGDSDTVGDAESAGRSAEELLAIAFSSARGFPQRLQNFASALFSTMQSGQTNVSSNS